jgi:hypothetical protein
MDSHYLSRATRGTRVGTFFLTLVVSAVTLGAAQPGAAAPKKDSCQVKPNKSGSIQEAIVSGCTSIRVFPGTYTENLVIESGSVSISGVSKGRNTIINGGGNGSVVTVGSDANVTLEDVTLENGDAVLGGGVYNLGSVSLINTTVRNSFAGYGGGAIFNQFGKVTLSNSLITDNFAVVVGGGIFNNEGTVTINDSSVTNNEAVFQGGGIFNNKGSLTVTDSLVIGNAAGFNGGGIINLLGTVAIPGSTVTGNTPDDKAGF